jgi:DNA-binding response OmpR family regulator
MRLLVVEDDPSISAPLVTGLRREGFEVHAVATGADALAAEGYDLVLLDLGLPDIDGHSVCRVLRAEADVPIIVVTARDDEVDRVRLLESGADDYIVKPFGFRELVARVRAVLRRSATAEEHRSEVIEHPPLRIDTRTRTTELRGRPVALTPKEYDLLVALASDPGAVVTREELLRDVWDHDWWGSTKTLDVHIASLRRKLEPELIQTVRGVGYRMAP